MLITIFPTLDLLNSWIFGLGSYLTSSHYLISYYRCTIAHSPLRIILHAWCALCINILECVSRVSCTLFCSFISLQLCVRLHLLFWSALTKSVFYRIQTNFRMFLLLLSSSRMIYFIFWDMLYVLAFSSNFIILNTLYANSVTLIIRGLHICYVS